MPLELAQTGLTVSTYIVLGLVVLLVGAALFIVARALRARNKDNRL
ncbi:LPXTG cell wall anchor domain-containing protein [Agreia sp. PsM10]|jgi:LPXTG-motif cell wall-anchored protein|nr:MULTISPECIES: LPXTG cell wall anchor domain-containing protein [unclassified Agreia]MDN4642103.1 LPXTG cell wall anchor domain-containing protein [Agreia sp. PsM10]